MKLVVGSTNPVKIEAVKVLPGVSSVLGVSAPSGVPEQPLGHIETLKGAINRAMYAESFDHDAFGVGLEGGCEILENRVEMFAYAAITKGGITGYSLTEVLTIPEELASRVRDGMELGPATDEVYGTENIKQKEGTVWWVTGGRLTRQKFYEPAVLEAYHNFLLKLR